MKEQSASSGKGFGTIGVLGSYLLARIAPPKGVRRLISKLDDSDEDTSMAAYMALVKLGPPIAGCLLEEARQGRAPVHLLRVLGDLGDPEVVPSLAEFAESRNAEVASAAREAIDALRAPETL